MTMMMMMTMMLLMLMQMMMMIICVWHVTVRASTARDDPSPTALEFFKIYTAPHMQEPMTLVTPRFTQHSCARESFSKNLGKDFLVAA